MIDKVAKTFERFLRYETGMGYEDFYNLYPWDDGEDVIKELFTKWIELEHPINGRIEAARFNLSQFGWEV